MTDAKPETPESAEPTTDPQAAVEEVIVIEEHVVTDASGEVLVDEVVVEEVAVLEDTAVEATVGDARVVDATPAADSAPPAPPAPPTAPAGDAWAVTPPAAQQVVYVQAPVPPRAAGNRGVGTLYALLAAIAFGVLLAGATWLIQYATTGATGVGYLATWDFYIPIAVFAIAFVLLVLLVNRAGWGAHVLGSLVVGAVVYFGTIGIDLLVNWLVWQVQDGIGPFLMSPFHIVAAVLAREVALWFGWIIARRGKKIAARNAAARADFDARLADFHAGVY